jgi:hypothetical protein
MKRSLNKFLLKLLLYVALVVIGFEALYRVGILPAETFSALFDYKMRQARDLPSDLKIISIGSSEALDGINSAMVADSLDPAYHNFASWGMQMSDTREILPMLLQQYKPKMVILGASLWDFMRPASPSYSAYARTPMIFRRHLPEYFYLGYYRPLRIIYQRSFTLRSFDKMRICDRWGGATAAAPGRFVPGAEDMTFPTASTAAHYQALEEISESLQRRKIRLIFVQMPIEARYFAIDSLKGKVATFFSECRRRVEGHGGIYLNYGDLHLPDSLFIDLIHVDSMGGVVVTRKLLADLKAATR